MVARSGWTRYEWDVERVRASTMFSRDKQQLLMVTARAVEVLAVHGRPAPDGQLYAAVVGDVRLTYLDADHRIRQETYGARDATMFELAIPAPVDQQVMAHLHLARREARKIGVYAEYRLSEGVPVAVESFTMVGDGLYVDLGARRGARR